MNRLKLDFSLETAEERKNFIDTYIVQFPDLTQTEAETIADYLLWGKDAQGQPIGAGTGLKTRWTKGDDIESLDAVLDNPAYTNVQFQPFTEATPLKAERKVFNRQAVREAAPDYLRDSFEALWRKIDEDDLLINFYELGVGKRDKPPRKELLDRFSESEQVVLSRRAAELSQFQYLKLRHELVELRREQFTMRDSFVNTLNPHQGPTGLDRVQQHFGLDLDILPLGTAAGRTGELIFNTNFDPRALNEEQLRLIGQLLNEKREVEPGPTVIDFRDLETVYQLYLMREDCADQIEREHEINFVEGNLEDIYRTLDFYESIADLTEAQHKLLRMKEAHVHNADIARVLNEEFDKNYTANYISTIFRQKIIEKINAAAQLHLDSVENCFYPENFKQCTECGRVLLLDERNWVRKNKSKDGFQNRCKRCDRKKRKKKEAIK